FEDDGLEDHGDQAGLAEVVGGLDVRHDDAPGGDADVVADGDVLGEGGFDDGGRVDEDVAAHFHAAHAVGREDHTARGPPGEVAKEPVSPEVVPGEPDDGAVAAVLG